MPCSTTFFACRETFAVKWLRAKAAVILPSSVIVTDGAATCSPNRPIRYEAPL